MRRLRPSATTGPRALRLASAHRTGLRKDPSRSRAAGIVRPGPRSPRQQAALMTRQGHASLRLLRSVIRWRGFPWGANSRVMRHPKVRDETDRPGGISRNFLGLRRAAALNGVGVRKVRYLQDPPTLRRGVASGVCIRAVQTENFSAPPRRRVTDGSLGRHASPGGKHGSVPQALGPLVVQTMTWLRSGAERLGRVRSGPHKKTAPRGGLST